ncbi:pyridoxamine 5'-phosphate oxidase family protein [Microbacterium terrisoli]|jgi:nitroimidazol reductase NimA-like FMN-containing flavoprotein (pyridoxamine 5'-phosphate oxidase superfamily)|uniref:pyridoxamine 5'-phosphate oxidase family protein n=1 Tax=Microbacterium terrisoli TaxID=3242192 RepID=UPI002805DDE4|nr:pyridoxamine 5'-phosphate oxidase family protein [Microbacterium protaetiae]
MDEVDAVVTLDEDQCWDQLRTQVVGRLVTRVGERIDIFPVNYVVDERTVLFRTAEGGKLFGLTVNDQVLFEADGHTDADAWSVVVRGSAERLDTAAEVERADGLGLRPWIPTMKRNYVRVIPSTLTGRAFGRAPEPDRDGVQQY